MSGGRAQPALPPGQTREGGGEGRGGEAGRALPAPWLLTPPPRTAVDKTDYMVGSYGPRAEEYEFLTPMEEAPKGMLARGSYNIKSRFTDDDKTDHLSWEWNLTIKKDWKD